MNRYVVIPLVVLLPFAALVVWGFSTSPRESPAAPVPAAPAPPLAVPSAPPVQVAVAAPAPVAVAAPVPQAAPEPPPAPAPAPPVEAATRVLPDPAAESAVMDQLSAQVNPCFVGADGRVEHKNRVFTRFRVLPDGSLMDVRIRAERPDPAVQACVHKALKDARVDVPKGLSKAPMRYAFAAKGR